MSRKSRVRAPPGAVLHELHQAGWLVTVRWRSCSPVDFATPSPFFSSHNSTFDSEILIFIFVCVIHHLHISCQTLLSDSQKGRVQQWLM
jgi:hypothetical protein